jgi:hypothetical protein
MARKPGDTLADQEQARRERRKDGRALIEQKGRERGGMYLLGYAIECALKCYVMRKLRVTTLGDAERLLEGEHGENCLTRDHSLERLHRVAQSLGLVMSAPGGVFLASREVFKWSVDWRYKYRKVTPRDGAYFRDSVETLYRWIEREMR